LLINDQFVVAWFLLNKALHLVHSLNTGHSINENHLGNTQLIENKDTNMYWSEHLNSYNQ